LAPDRLPVADELVPGHVLQGLQAAPGLRKGRSEAREPEPVKPVSLERVEAIKPFVSRQVWAMIQLQLHTAARAGDQASPPQAPLAKRDEESKANWQKRLTEPQRFELDAWRKAHRWHPHQLRHNAATELRKEFGLEAAQILLGHTKADVTQWPVDKSFSRPWRDWLSPFGSAPAMNRWAMDTSSLRDDLLVP